MDGLGGLYNNCETDTEVYLICCPYFWCDGDVK